MDSFDRKRAEIAALFEEDVELGLYDLAREATFRVTSVNGNPPQHRILIMYYNDEIYLDPEGRSNTNRLTVSDLDYPVRFGEVCNHANIQKRVQNPGEEVMKYRPAAVIPSGAKVSLQDLLASAYRKSGYFDNQHQFHHDVTEEEARMAATEALGISNRDSGDEHEGDAPGKENDMDKNTEIASWKENHVLIDCNGDDALVMHKMADNRREFIVAHGYDEETGHWGHGTYYDSLASAAADLEGRVISAVGEEVICPDFWYRADIEIALENAGIEVNDANVDAVLEDLDLHFGWGNSQFRDRLAEDGNEMIASAVGIIDPDGSARTSPEHLHSDGLDLDVEASATRDAAHDLALRQPDMPEHAARGR